MRSNTVVKRQALYAVRSVPHEATQPAAPPPQYRPGTFSVFPQAAMSWTVLCAQFSAVAMANMVLMGSLAMDSMASNRRPAAAARDAEV